MSQRQRGFTLIEFLFVLALGLILATYAWHSRTVAFQESQARATAQYLLSVREGVVAALIRHEAAFSLTDVSTAPAGTYEAAPSWARFTGESISISVKDLKDAKLLSSTFPDTPPVGRSVVIRFLRAPGTCPGIGCQVEAFVYTCWPMDKPGQLVATDITNCPAPKTASFSANMLGAAIAETKGLGGSNASDSSVAFGALFQKTAIELGIPAGSPGHLVVAASLNTTPFGQFLRQGEIRPAYFNTGIVLNTKVVRDAICQPEGMFATSTAGILSQCQGGHWFEVASYVVTSMQSLPNGAAVPAPVCPGANMQAFSYASLEKTDVTMTGTDVHVRGNVNGTISGSGAVSQSGSVSVSGTYTGTVVSAPDSSIRVSQGVDVSSGSVVMTPANVNARALVVSGCRRND